MRPRSAVRSYPGILVRSFDCRPELVLGMAGITAVPEVVLYSEDFQSYANPLYNFVGSGNGWTGVGMIVNQTNSIGAAGSFFSGSGAALRSLYIADSVTNSSLNQMLIYSSTNSGASSISNNGNVKISFDFNIRSNGAAGSAGISPMFDLRCPTAVASWAVTLSLGATTNRTFGNYTNGSNRVDIPGVGITTANWYRVEMVIGDLSTANDTYNLKVWEATPAGGYNQTGSLVLDVSNLLFRADVSYIDGFDFRTIVTNAGSVCNIDNIRVGTVAIPSGL